MGKTTPSAPLIAAATTRANVKYLYHAMPYLKIATMNRCAMAAIVKTPWRAHPI